MLDFKTMAAVPYGRIRGSAIIDDYIYTFTVDANDYYQRYDIKANTWVALGRNTIGGLSGLAVISCGKRIFLLAFRSNTLGIKFYEYVISTGAIVGKADVINGLTKSSSTFISLAICATDEKIYIFSPKTDNFVRAYDVKLDVWSLEGQTLNGESGSRYGDFTAAYSPYSKKIYIVGGGDPNKEKLREYDPIKRTWKLLANLPLGRTSPVAIAFKNKLLIGSGMSAASTYLTSYDEYEIDTDTWVSSGTLPYAFYTRGAGLGGYYRAPYLFIAGIAYPNVGNSPGVITRADTRGIELASPAPTAGFIDENADNTFSWVTQSDPETDTQAGATFQWRVSGGANVNTINLATESSVTIPAGTLPNGSIEWRVKAVNTGGLETEYTNWFTLSTADVRHTKPTGLSPNGSLNDASKRIQFSWLHHSPISAAQKAFEIQYTVNGGASWLELGGVVTSGEPRYLSEPDTFPGATIGWRVRTYNTENLASEWSDDAYFTSAGQPPTPVFRSVETGKSRPLCQWISQEQAGYQLQIVRAAQTVYDTGEVHGGDTSHKVGEYLQNGQYTVRLRIKNATGLWSEWAEYTASVHAEKRMKVTLSGEPVKNGARLMYEVEVIS